MNSEHGPSQIPQIVKDCLEQYIILNFEEVTKSIKYDQIQVRTSHVSTYDREKHDLVKIIRGSFNQKV